ncbi:unnamed protein product [Adineta ricciae]|uniref:3CxxC-type domain-containing protein n=1 Tax=Adineta ricciae TaxID=249248 RepID=A0A815IBC3_ADIRI|nr:unnamed protein product [Adineta ricciae]CAF1682602.1 unnamed protein product [Adineta ricciae]
MAQNQLFLQTFTHWKQIYMNSYPNMNFLRQWHLEQTEDPEIVVTNDSSQQILKRYSGAQFHCARCGNQWFSRIHSSILFQYYEHTRIIKWKLFGQQCRRCRQEFVIPTYQPDSITETIRYLIEKLAFKTRRVDLRPIDPDRPTILYNGNRHREDDLTCFCEACKLRRQYCEN